MKTDNIKQWLASSHCNVPYELDFFTPFKNMVAEGAVQRGKEDAVKRKHDPASSQGGRSHISISSEHFETLTTSSDSSYKYKRRPRHKTREDLYEYKGGRPLASRPHQRPSKKESKRRSKEEPNRRKKHKKRAKKDVADQFHAKNVSADRLTFNHSSGLFRQGKASAPIRKAGPPDLAFSERAFLKLRDDYHAPQKVELDDAVGGAKDSKRRKDRQQEREAKISEYFRQPLHGRDINLPNTVEGRARSNFDRPVIYETPCHQRQPNPGPSSLVLANVPLPGPPYLGFGERGPAPAPQSSFRQSPSGPPASDAVAQPVLPTRREMQSVGDFPSSDKTESQDTAITFAADPRAFHSPTSNFNFAKLQYERHRISKKHEHQQTALPHGHEEKRPNEMLELLRDLKHRRMDVAAEGSARSGQTIGQQDLGKTTEHVDIPVDEAPCKTMAEELQQVEQSIDQGQIMNNLAELLDLLKRRDQSLKDNNHIQPEDTAITRVPIVAGSAGQTQQQQSGSFGLVEGNVPVGVEGTVELGENSKCNLLNMNKDNTDSRDEHNGGSQSHNISPDESQESHDRQALARVPVLDLEDNGQGGRVSALDTLPFVGLLRPIAASTSVRPASQGPAPRRMFGMPSIYQPQSCEYQWDGTRHDCSTFIPPVSSTPGLRHLTRTQSPWRQHIGTSQQARLEPATRQVRITGFGESLPRPDPHVYSSASPSIYSETPSVRHHSLPDQDELDAESMFNQRQHNVNNEDESFQALDTYTHLRSQGGRFSPQSFRPSCAGVRRPMSLLQEDLSRGSGVQEHTHALDGFWRPNVLY